MFTWFDGHMILWAGLSVAVSYLTVAYLNGRWSR